MGIGVGFITIAPIPRARRTTVNTFTIQEAQARLSEVIRRLAPGEEVLITDDDRPVARLTRVAAAEPKPRRLGTMRGTVLHMAPDFDGPFDDSRA